MPCAAEFPSHWSLTIRAEKNTETGPPAKTPVRYPFKTRDIEKTRFLKTIFLAFPAEESVDFFTGEISGLIRRNSIQWDTVRTAAHGDSGDHRHPFIPRQRQRASELFHALSHAQDPKVAFVI